MARGGGGKGGGGYSVREGLRLRVGWRGGRGLYFRGSQTIGLIFLSSIISRKSNISLQNKSPGLPLRELWLSGALTGEKEAL